VLGVGVALLEASGTFATMALLVAFAGLSILFMLGAMLWVLLRFLFAPQVLVSESLGLWPTIRRSGALVSGRIGPGWLGLVGLRAAILVSVMGAVVSAVQFLFGLPTLVLQAVFRNGDLGQLTSATIPWALRLPLEALQIAGVAFTSPLFVIF